VNEKTARWLLNLRQAAQSLWAPRFRDEDRSPMVNLLAQTVSYSCDKALQSGGWTVYYDPIMDRTEITR
jgi:hypothetical protein